MKRYLTSIFAFLGAVLLLAGCMTQPDTADAVRTQDNLNPGITQERIVPGTGQKIPVTTTYDPGADR